MMILKSLNELVITIIWQMILFQLYTIWKESEEVLGIMVSKMLHQKLQVRWSTKLSARALSQLFAKMIVPGSSPT